MVEPSTENVFGKPIDSDFLVKLIERLWSVYAKNNDDLKLMDVFIEQAKSGEIFWTFHKVIRHCEFFKWNILVGLSKNPKEYYEKCIQPYEHALDDE
jgi:hypothetical protein